MSAAADRDAEYLALLKQPGSSERDRKLEIIAGEQASEAAAQRGLALTETGNAERFADDVRGSVAFIREWGMWSVTDPSGRWREDPSEIRVGALVKQSNLALYNRAAATSDDRARAAIVQWAKASERRSIRESTLKLARQESEMAVSFREFDTDPLVLGTAAGLLDLRTATLRPMLPRDRISRAISVAFDPAATAERWVRFLREVLPDAGTREFFQRAVGYGLTGLVSEHCLFFLWGQGANGKSTALDILLELLGDYGNQAPSSLLLARHGEAHPTELTILHGRRLVACQEVDENRRWAEAQVKHLTGGDPITARRMREDFWTFSPLHKLFIAANHKPEVRGNDVGIWRRIKLIPFTVVIPEGDRDPRLKNTLRSEMAGILNWAIEGCLAWQREGLGTPTAVVDATAAYRADSDLVGRWVSDECALDATAPARTRSAVRTAFEAWCEREGEHPVAARSFTERLRLLGLQEVSGVRDGERRERGWRGIRLHVDTSLQQSGIDTRSARARGDKPELVSTSVDVSTDGEDVV